MGLLFRLLLWIVIRIIMGLWDYGTIMGLWDLGIIVIHGIKDYY